jgi:hypothetical protein
MSIASLYPSYGLAPARVKFRPVSQRDRPFLQYLPPIANRCKHYFLGDNLIPNATVV